MTFDDIVLASASPRRRELLSLVVPEFRVVVSGFDEAEVPTELAPAKHATFSAIMKATDIAEKNPDALVIGADTIVSIDGLILGKPADNEEATRMLNMLSGRTHQVLTGICVMHDERQIAEYETTSVTFAHLQKDWIEGYVRTGEPLDKAGAYAIQGKGSILIESITGCYFNVVGLPLFRLGSALTRLGYAPFK
jgi:septum formation protein